MTVTDHDDIDPGAPEAPDVPVPPVRGRMARRRRSTPTVPVARFDPGRVADTRRRNPTWIVAGVLLVVLSALGGVVLFTSNDDREEVLVAANDLEPGAVVEADDLRIERVALDAGIRAISAADAAGLVGRHATGRVPAGTMLAPAMFTTDVPLGADEVVVGASLDPGEAPLALLEVGASVELLDVTVAVPDAGEGGAEAATSLGTGTVWAAQEIATGQLWLSVRVERSVGLAVSVAAATDRLRVALIGGAG